MNDPVVSIITLSFNHEVYIAKCLDGFVMQKTTFPFEVLIHDDASTDNTTTIIRAYQKKYPEIIKPIFQTENQYSKGVSIGAKYLYPKAKGKYIAICEGDDYWNDPYKLQKQYEYMEANPGCALCFTNAIIHWYNNEFPDTLFADFEERDYSGVELTERWISPTASFFFRSSILPEYMDIREKYPQIIIGDSPLLLTCAKNGAIHGFPYVTCVYGKHSNSWTHYSDAGRTFASALSWEYQRKAFGKEYNTVMTNILTGQYLLAIRRGLKEKNWAVILKAFWRGICFQPITAFHSIKKLLYEKKHK